MKKGLVLEGGAMRGMFTSGVLDVFMEHNINFDGAIGVSAGATFGCNFKSRQIGRAIRYNKKYSHDWRYCSFKSLITTGDLYGAEFCYDTLPNKLDVFDLETYRANPLEFYVVASDIINGVPVYKKLESCNKDDLTWMRASASMPLVSKPVLIDGYTLLDGGITDTIPLKYFESIGYQKNVVILTQARNFKKPKIEHLALMKLFLRKYPKVLEALKNRHLMYNSQTEYIFEQEKKGNVFVITPQKSLQISRTEKDPDELERVYQEGRAEANRVLDDVKRFLAL